MKIQIIPKNKTFLIVCGIVFAILLVASIWFWWPVKRTIKISGNGKIKEPVKLALVSDLHSCYYGKNQSAIIKMIDEENVDAILLAGDIFDDKLGDKNSKIFIEDVVKKYPCFYVSGNHEYWSERSDEMKEYLRSVGVVVLEGDCEEIELKGNTIDICGINDPTRLSKREWIEEIDAAYKASDENNYRILISHRPEEVETYANYDFDLVVAGHAHGGQWKIPFTKLGVAAPNQGLFPKYVDGRIDLSNGSIMIVSRGLARESTPAPRFFNHPEIIFIEVGE